MNIGLVFIWLVALLLIIWNFSTDYTIRSNYSASKRLTVAKGGDVCVFALEDVAEISAAKCCVSDGVQDGTRIVNTDGGLTLRVGTYPTYYMTACKGACTTGVKTGGSECNNPNDTIKYEECINITNPGANCLSSAKPVARIGTQFYYVQEYSSGGCDTVETCTT